MKSPFFAIARGKWLVVGREWAKALLFLRVYGIAKRTELRPSYFVTGTRSRKLSKHKYCSNEGLQLLFSETNGFKKKQERDEEKTRWLKILTFVDCELVSMFDGRDGEDWLPRDRSGAIIPGTLRVRKRSQSLPGWACT